MLKIFMNLNTINGCINFSLIFTGISCTFSHINELLQLLLLQLLVCSTKMTKLLRWQRWEFRKMRSLNLAHRGPEQNNFSCENFCNSAKSLLKSVLNLHGIFFFFLWWGEPFWIWQLRLWTYVDFQICHISNLAIPGALISLFLEG